MHRQMKHKFPMRFGASVHGMRGCMGGCVCLFQELMYISALDVRKDIEMLRGELPMLREESLRMLEVRADCIPTRGNGDSFTIVADVFSRTVLVCV